MREKLFPTTLPTKEDEEMRKAMIQMLTDFARTGYEDPFENNPQSINFSSQFKIYQMQESNARFELFATMGSNESLPSKLLSYWEFEF